MEATILSNSEQTFPAVCETPVAWGNVNLQRTDDYKAIVNPETGKVFSIVSKGYKLIRHEEAVFLIERVLNKSSPLGRYDLRTEFYNDGGRMLRTYRFFDKKVEIQKGDTVSPELHLFNSYDSSWPFTVTLGGFRFVCANGLVVGKLFLYLRKRHVYDFNQIDIEDEVVSAFDRFNLQTKQWSNWSERKLTENEFIKTLKGMKFGQEATNQIRQKVESEAKGYLNDGFPSLSTWTFYNVLTWYITHRAVSLNHRVEMERRLRALLEGSF